MPNLAFKALIDNFNAQLESMNKNDFKLYDPDNREYFIKKIVYDHDDDKFLCEFEEEGN